MTRIMVPASLLLLFCAAGFAQEGGKVVTPAEVWRDFQLAKADDNTAFKHLTKASRYLLLGQKVMMIENIVMTGAAEDRKQAIALRKDFGLEELDLTAALQGLSMGRRDVTPAFVQAGAWVKDPQKFTEASAELLRKWNERRLVSFKERFERGLEELGKAEDDQGERIAQERSMLKQRLDDVNAQLEELKKPATEKTPPKLMELADVKIEGDKAKGFVEIDGEKQPVAFEKEEGVWKVALCESSTLAKGPTDAERASLRLANRGRLDVDSQHCDVDDEGYIQRAGPNFFSYEANERLTARLEDQDLAALAKIETIRRVSLIGAVDITDQGILEIGKLQDLRQLMFREVSLSEKAMQSLAKIKKLRSLRLEGVKVSKEALAKFKADRADCKVTVRYLLKPERIEDRTLAEVRDKDRLVMVIFESAFQEHYRGYGDPEDVGDRDPDDADTQALFQYLSENNVQVLQYAPFHAADKPEWWKDKPFLEPHASPQVVFFPKGSAEPLKLAAVESMPYEDAGLQKKQCKLSAKAALELAKKAAAKK